MHIVVAPNAFKNSLDAAVVADAISAGLKKSKLDCTLTCFPVADGGDGTSALIIEKCEGTVMPCEVHDPLGRKIKSSFGLIDKGKTAIIEMADASGLRLLEKNELNPIRASSYGTGELIKFALDKGARKIIIGMGGSATVDGGCGILDALGIRFLDAAGKSLRAIPEDLQYMATVDVSALDPGVLNCEIVILCDVNNKLLGPNGAAAVFGPQKGAKPKDVELLDAFLANFAAVSRSQTGTDMAGIDHSGTAGGAAAGLHAWLNAKLVNGIGYFLSLTDFDQALQRCDLVVTGEGSIDRQTLEGKGPYGVAVRAKNKNIPVIGMAGKVPPEPDEELNKYFNVLVSINNDTADLAAAMKNTRENLIRTAETLGNLLADKSGVRI